MSHFSWVVLTLDINLFEQVVINQKDVVLLRKIKGYYNKYQNLDKEIKESVRKLINSFQSTIYCLRTQTTRWVINLRLIDTIKEKKNKSNNHLPKDVHTKQIFTTLSFFKSQKDQCWIFLAYKQYIQEESKEDQHQFTCHIRSKERNRQGKKVVVKKIINS